MLLAVAVLLVIAGAVGWFGWHRQVTPSIESVTLDAKEYYLGDPIKVALDLKLPWHLRASDNVRMQLPPDLDKLGDATQELHGLGFGWWRCRVVVTLQAYGFGPFGKLPWTLQLRGGSSPPSMEGKVPVITVKPRLDAKSDAKLAVAGALPESYLKKHMPWPIWVWWCIVIGVVALSAFIAWVAWRMAHQEMFVPEPPKPWVVAAEELSALEEQLETLEPDAFFLSLTDIIRRYIEAAYHLPATESTTQEFLRTINRPKGPLTTDQRLVLADFLTAADMIKFARGEATVEQLREGLTRARQFVVESSSELMRQAAAPAEAAEPEPEATAEPAEPEPAATANEEESDAQSPPSA